MSDLPERLRKAEQETPGHDVDTDLFLEAADEIERLRERESTIYKWAKAADPHDVGIGDLEEYLEGKRDSLE